MGNEFETEINKISGIIEKDKTKTYDDLIKEGFSPPSISKACQILKIELKDLEVTKEVYDPKKEIEKISEKHKIYLTDRAEANALEIAGFLPLVHKELLSFLEQKKPYGYYILSVTDPNNKEHSYPVKIKYEGGGKIETKGEKMDRQTMELLEFRDEVLTQLSLRKRDKATELLVEKIKEDNNIYTTRDDVKSEMWIYQDGVYIPQGKTFIKEFCRKVLEKIYTSKLGNRVNEKRKTNT